LLQTFSLCMHHILIPTDFSITSVNLAAQAARQIGGRCNIYLFHALDVPDDLLDIMHRSGVRGDGRLITEDIRVRCKKVKSEHYGIANIYIRILYGSTLAAFKSFAEANTIDLVFLPEAYKFRSVVRDSVDPTDWFRKSGIPVIVRQPGTSKARNITSTVSSFTLN